MPRAAQDADRGSRCQQRSPPRSISSYAGRSYVVLDNANGILAVYRIRDDGVLKRLRRWPPELGAA